MKRFEYVRANDADHALTAIAADASAQFLAGGTNVVDLLKYDVATPSLLVDVGGLSLNRVEVIPNGDVRIGALTTNAHAAYHSIILERYPLLSSAILAGASPQIRNMATTAGNLKQRTRCPYFYDAHSPCNKRAPGTGCPAVQGVNRNHAILGASEYCVATHPSDMCVALAALNATVQVQNNSGVRDVPIAEFHRLPGDTPHIDHTVPAQDLIVSVTLPAVQRDSGFSYLKVRDRLSFAFALVSVASRVTVDDGRIADAAVALGGVAHKPWRDTEAEQLLINRPPSRETFDKFARFVLRDARGLSQNNFKIELARRIMIRALTQAANGTPQSQNAKQIR